MARSDIQHLLQGEVSPLMTTRLLKKPRKNRKLASKAQPEVVETLVDLKELHTNLLKEYCDHVDTVFPNADFLAQQPGSHIQPGTKLSFILRTRYSNLTKMAMPKTLIENFRKTVRNFLDKARFRKNGVTASKTNHQAASLTKMIGAVSAASDSMETLKALEAEVERLQALNLTPKTIDRRVREE